MRRQLDRQAARAARKKATEVEKEGTGVLHSALDVKRIKRGVRKGAEVINCAFFHFSHVNMHLYILALQKSPEATDLPQ